VLFGLLPAHRLPLDCYYGFVLAKNRVPIAYGGGWMFGERCEIGINVFDTFRGGASALIFGQLLRLYHQHFGVTRFTVEPYQFGASNPEAIRSAALWFYYRFGFRPQDATLAAVAAREWQRLHATPGHRTSPRVLQRLTASFLELDLAPHADQPRYEPAALSLALTAWIGHRFAGERPAARSWAGRYVRHALGVSADVRWPQAERRAFDDLAPLVAPLPDLADWAPVEKRALVRLLRSKGGAQERRFAQELTRHHRLRAAWGQWLQRTC
jgi:hypothetical protein